MDINKSEDKDEIKDKAKTKKKKNKNKERKRLMSLLRGPKVVHNLYHKCSEDESRSVKQSVIDIMSANSCLKLHEKRAKDEKNIENKSKRNEIKLTNDLVLGLNSVIRSVEKKSIIGVILTNPLALPLIDNIIELCSDRQIPCLSVQSLDELKTYLNISSLTAIAFKPNVSSNESKFNNCYKIFDNIIHKNCKSIESNEPKAANEEIRQKVDNICVKTEKNELSFDKNLFDILYTKESDDNYCQLVANHMKNVSESKNKKDLIASQESFLAFSSKTGVYFPETIDSNKIFTKIEVILDEQQMNSSRDDSFAQNIIESIDESDRRKPKRKRSQQNDSDLFDFKSPQIVRLEPSVNRMNNRKQRKQMKKLKKSSKNS